MECLALEQQNELVARHAPLVQQTLQEETFYAARVTIILVWAGYAGVIKFNDSSLAEECWQESSGKVRGEFFQVLRLLLLMFPKQSSLGSGHGVATFSCYIYLRAKRSVTKCNECP